MTLRATGKVATVTLESLDPSLLDKMPRVLLNGDPTRAKPGTWGR